MKNELWIAAATVCTVATQSADAQEEKSSRHHFGIQVPVWFNAEARFKMHRATNPGPNNGNPAMDRFYDDGYNRVDSTGNMVSPDPPAKYAINRTSFFGYNSSIQAVNDPNPADSELADPMGGTLSLHSSSVTGGQYGEALKNRLLPGIELFYRFDLTESKHWALGLETAASWQRFKWDQYGSVQADVNQITDIYPLGGVTLTPGLAPYPGIFDNTIPGVPVIGSTPTRTIGNTSAIVNGRRQLELDSFVCRLGPSLDWKTSARLNIGLLGGVALGWANSRLSFNDQISFAFPGTPDLAQAGLSSDSQLWTGFYSALRVNYTLSKRWNVNFELRHLWHQTLNHDGGIRSADINMSRSLGVAAGLSYSF